MRPPGSERALRDRADGTAMRLREGIVTRSDAGGVFVTPMKGDSRHPLGPVRGALYLDHEVVVGGGLRSVWRQLPERSVVLLASLPQQAPWVLAWEPPSGPQQLRT